MPSNRCEGPTHSHACSERVRRLAHTHTRRVKTSEAHAGRGKARAHRARKMRRSIGYRCRRSIASRVAHAGERATHTHKRGTQYRRSGRLIANETQNGSADKGSASKERKKPNEVPADQRKGERDEKRPSSSTSCFIGFCVCTILGSRHSFRCSSQNARWPSCVRVSQRKCVKHAGRCEWWLHHRVHGPHRRTKSSRQRRTEDEPRRASHSPDANDGNTY